MIYGYKNEKPEEAGLDQGLTLRERLAGKDREARRKNSLDA